MSPRSLPRLGTMVLAVVLLGAPAFGSVNVPQDFATIQAAIDAAAPGDKIVIGPGTWHEALVWNAKPLMIQGDLGPAFTVIDGGGASATISATWTQGMLLRGVTVTGGVNGLVVQGGNAPLAENCVFRGNAQFGLVAESVLYGQVTDCHFAGNGAGGARLVVSGAVFPLATSVAACAFSAGDGLVLELSGPYAIANVSFCSFDGGTISASGAALSVSHCILRNAAVPFSAASSSVTWSDVQGGWPGTGNIDVDPLWVDPAAGDLSLLPLSPCLAAGDPAGGNTPSLGAIQYESAMPLGGAIVPKFEPPVLVIFGSMQQGTTVTFRLGGYFPPPSFLLVLGGSSLAQPFKGGALWPHPDVVMGPFFSVPGQVINDFLVGAIPPGLPLYAPFWAQVVWPDAAAPAGWYMTGAYRCITW